MIEGRNKYVGPTPWPKHFCNKLLKSQVSYRFHVIVWYLLGEVVIEISEWFGRCQGAAEIAAVRVIQGHLYHPP